MAVMKLSPGARCRLLLLAGAGAASCHLGMIPGRCEPPTTRADVQEAFRRYDVVAEAIVAYTRDAGHRPRRLIELVPLYLEKLPEAPGATSALDYEARSGNDFVLVFGFTSSCAHVCARGADPHWQCSSYY